jgi:hypothetical protein
MCRLACSWLSTALKSSSNEPILVLSIRSKRKSIQTAENATSKSISGKKFANSLTCYFAIYRLNVSAKKSGLNENN